MAAYPSFAQLEDSRRVIVDGRELVRASNGAPKVRLLQAADKRSWQIVHLLSAADFATLETFISTNAALAFDFTWDAVVYTCIFGAPALEEQWTEFGWRVLVRIEEQ